MPAATATLAGLRTRNRHLLSTLVALGLLTSSATLWLYLSAALGALKQRPTGLGLIAVLLGLAFTLFAFYGSGKEANLWSLGLLAAAGLVYVVMRRLRASSPLPAETVAAPVE